MNASLTGRMRRVCMDCRQEYGTVPCVSSQDGLETHGVCAGCVPARMADVEAITFSTDVTTCAPADCVEPCVLARELGLSLEVLRRHQPRHWVKGVDIVQRGAGVFWRRVSLSELVGELVVSGQLEAAKRLLSFLISEGKSGAPGAAARKGAPAGQARVSWLNRWEEENA